MKEIMLHKEIFIPKVNEYPFEMGYEWLKRGYTKLLLLGDEQRANIETADYVEKMTFGKWRLIGSSSSHPDVTAGPLDTTLECLKPYMSDWGKFRREFTRELKITFEAICNSNYLPAMVKEMNDRINQLLGRFAKEVIIHLDFVLHLETLESYDSPRFLELRSRIYEHYTGNPLDLSKYPHVTTPIPGRPCQMDMHLDLSITMSHYGQGIIKYDVLPQN
jgi:hypothetical protein